MLEVSNICKTYTTRKPYREVLHNISFAVREQEFVSLLGSSGCGKTTLLTMIAGFHKASAGGMSIKGRRITQPGADRGFVFQNYALFPWLTVRQNVQFPMKERGLSRGQRQALCQKLFSMAQLTGSEDLYPSQLSGGMKQRVAFIRALAGSPDILLLDEPLGAVDPQMRKTLQVELENLWLQDRTTVLMVTHDIDESVFLSDRVLIMVPCDTELTRQKDTNLVADIAIKLPRPRNRENPEYQKILKEVERHLMNLAPLTSPSSGISGLSSAESPQESA